MPFKTNKPFKISLTPDNVVIELSLNSTSKKTVNRSLEASRAYILSNYNWNGVIKLMRFVYKQHTESYLVPDQLNGDEADNKLILPDLGIAYLISLQLIDALKGTTSASNSSLILKKADGKPGKFFFKSIIKKEKLPFLNEANNKAQKDPDTNQKLIPPSSDASPAEFYQYFKKIVKLRNGIWSNKKGFVNLIGLRRVVVKKRASDAGYNDTIACCWLDKQGNPQCELNIATTEPGNRQRSRQLFPQTMTMVPGYHNLRQPAGRTRNALKEGSNVAINRGRGNDRELQWCPGDTTMNFHQGGNTFRYPSSPGLTASNAKKERKIWLSKFGLTAEMQKGIPSSKADSEQLFQLNLVLSEIYLLLSKYGEDGQKAPYKNLEAMLGHAPIKQSAIKNGTVTVRQQGFNQKVINVAHVKERTVKIWFDNRRKEKTKKKIYEILKHVSDFSQAEIKTWENFSFEQVLNLIKDEHVERIIEIQSQYLTHINKGVDGIAGNQFYNMISGIYQNKAEAKKDKVRLDELLNQLDSLPVRKSLKNIFKRSMVIKTYLNRKNVFVSTKHLPEKDMDIVDNFLVGGYSAGCQVFFDTEVFYTFWTKLLQRASLSGQRRWYYTLIDATNFKKSDVIN